MPYLLVVDVEVPGAAGAPGRLPEARHLTGRPAHRQQVQQPIGPGRDAAANARVIGGRPWDLGWLDPAVLCPGRGLGHGAQRSSRRAGLSPVMRARLR